MGHRTRRGQGGWLAGWLMGVAACLPVCQVLSGLKLSMDEFVDLCILCGCDYCSTIKGIGPKTALSLIRKYKCIENVLPNLNKKTNPLPPDWLNKRRKGAAAADKSKEAAEEKALKQKAAEAEEAEKKQQPVKEGDQGEAGEDKTSKATTDGGEEQQPKEEKEAGGDEEDGQVSRRQQARGAAPTSPVDGGG